MGGWLSYPTYKGEERRESIFQTYVADFSRIFSISEERIVPTIVTPEEVDLGDINLDVDDDSREVAEYCLPLIVLHFCGQTSHINDEDTDQGCGKGGKNLLHLGHYLKMLDKFLRQPDKVTDFTGEEEEYKLLLKLIATKRVRKRKEIVEQCFERLLRDSERFVQIYHQRGVESELLETKSYWGSRQQLLAGKVISDWVDKDNGPLDPLFGVLLNPTAGRVGPGDTGWFHDVLFDDSGHMAYHSAVHDAFGYLKTNHDVGPGYDYLKESTYFDTESPLAGQVPGISFWKKTIKEIQLKQKVLNHWRC